MIIIRTIDTLFAAGRQGATADELQVKAANLPHIGRAKLKQRPFQLKVWCSILIRQVVPSIMAGGIAWLDRTGICSSATEIRLSRDGRMDDWGFLHWGRSPEPKAHRELPVLLQD